MSIVYDSWDNNYKKPFGAIKTDEPCTFKIRIPKSKTPDTAPMLVIFRTGFKEHFIAMTKLEDDSESTIYTCVFSAVYRGIHYYYFAMSVNGKRMYIKRNGSNEGVIGDGDLFQLTVYESSFTTPDFLKGGVIYQIFPDRFWKSGEPHEIPHGRIIREDWDSTPYYKPDENGHVWNNDYFGGDLQGIEQKLPYLNSLGVTCIYLTPIFEAHENHRYNTADYFSIDPMLGTEEDFCNLCASAEEYGISIILDGVFSHTGADSIYFNKYNRYKSVGAYNSPDSEYFSWYTFYDYPDSYEAWWGIDTLPNVDENNPNFTEFICGENGVIRYWLERGAAGWRLDVADELPDKFIDKIRHAVKAVDSEKCVIGEVWEDASNKESYGVKRRYLLGSQLDSVMNYPFRDAILNYVSGGRCSDFCRSVLKIIENYPKPSVDTLMNFISTHDVERAINRLGGESFHDKSKDWMAEKYLTDEQYEIGKKRMKLAMVLQFFLPGVPSVYYGDEAGLQGYKDPFNRRCYPWGCEDTELIEFVSELSKIRKSSKVFIDGTLHFLIADKDILCFARARVERKKAFVIFVNPTDKHQDVHKNSKMVYRRFEVVKGNISNDIVHMPPYSYAAVKVEM